MLQGSSKQVFKQDKQETIRLNTVLNRSLMYHEVFEWEIGKPHRISEPMISHRESNVQEASRKFFKQNNERIKSSANESA